MVEVVLLIALSIAAAAGWLVKTALGWLAWFTVWTVLTIQMADSFLTTQNTDFYTTVSMA